MGLVYVIKEKRKQEKLAKIKEPNPDKFLFVLLFLTIILAVALFYDSIANSLTENDTFLYLLI